MSSNRTCLALALGAALSSGASAQVVEAFYDEPTGDRWMYPFTGPPATLLRSSTFSAS